MDGVLIRNFSNGTGLGELERFLRGSQIGGERGVAEGIFLAIFRNGPQLGDMEGFLVGDW